MDRAAIERAKRVGYWLLPPLFCLWFYRRALRIWFTADDFAWLGLGLTVFDTRTFLLALFGPQAQGTVRFLSERGFFLAFEWLFGVDPLPYRIWVLLTLFANLALLAAIMRRLTGSAAAGFLAPVLWTVNNGLAAAVCWLASYNQILCSFFLLAGFLAFLRHLDTGRRAPLLLAWAAFLLGFGALESIVVFPALLAAYTLAFAREHWRRTLPFAGVSVMFVIGHLAFIPKLTTDPNYRMHFDAALPRTLWTYWEWALGPSRLQTYAPPVWLGIAGSAIVTLAILAFLVNEVRSRRWHAALFLFWFLALIAPVLPLRDHLSDYYVASASVGIAMLLAFGLVSTWKHRWLRVAALLVVGIYVAASTAASRAMIHWYREGSRPVRALVEGVVEARALHPQKVILLDKVSSELFWSGVYDNPFRLFRIRGVYLTPGSEQRIVAHPEWGDVRNFVLPPGAARRALEREEAVVYEPGIDRIRNVTRQYTLANIVQLKDEVPRLVDAGDPLFAERLGPGWHDVDAAGSRWMSRRATVTIGGPQSAGQKLYISAFCPRELLERGPARLTVTAAGAGLGVRQLEQAGSAIELTFDLPNSLVGKDIVEFTVELDHSFMPASDRRELTLAFGTFAIR